MADVKDVHSCIAFVDRVDDSVNGSFLTEKQMAKFLTLRNDRSAVRISFQTGNCFGELVEPHKCRFGSVRFNKFEKQLHIVQGAVG